MLFIPLTGHRLVPDRDSSSRPIPVVVKISNSSAVHLWCRLELGKPPGNQESGAAIDLMPGNDLLSHGIHHTIIGAEQFHF